MFGRIRGWYNAYRRRLDVRILWPACKRSARGNLDLARAAFAVHAFADDAWADLDREEIIRRVDGLT